METTKNKLSINEEIFFNSLKNYINKPIYFYGSIQRDDYLPQKSDIDIDIFTDNIDSTLHLLQNFLNLQKSDFKKSLYKMDKTNTVIPGYKTKYVDPEGLNVEISLYDEKYKTEILREHQSKFNLPFYITVVLLFFKLLYYNLNIIPLSWYSKWKKFVTNYCFDNNKAEFVILDL